MQDALAEALRRTAIPGHQPGSVAKSGYDVSKAYDAGHIPNMEIALYIISHLIDIIDEMKAK